MSKGKNLTNNALYFQREIEGIYDATVIKQNPQLAKKFVDLDGKNGIDYAAKELLDELKDKKIPSMMPSSNCFKFNVKWCPKTGISMSSHSEYIKQFGEVFYEQTKLLIDRNQRQERYFEELNKNDMELLQEVLYHAHFCNETVEHFHGREDILNMILNYVMSNNDEPFVVHGNSGCGKTAILAKLTSEIMRRVPDPENYAVILRFLGTTTSTSNVIQTFNSIFHQIARIFNFKLPKRKLDTHLDILKYFKHQINRISFEYPNRKLVIILDSIDQLTQPAYSLDWVLNVLPPNVKIIFSTLPKHGGILHNFLSFCKNFESVDSLNHETAIIILNDWLKRESRSISEYQKSVIYNMFDKTELYPLYVKIIFDIVSKWPSFYQPDDEFKKCKTIDDCIRYLFNSLEFLHGRLLFSRSIIYMSAFQNGISENELEDVLR